MDNQNLDMLIVGNIVATLHAQGKDEKTIMRYLQECFAPEGAYKKAKFLLDILNAK